MRWIFGILYLVLCGTTGRVVSNIGYDFDSWQWWVCCGSVWISFICGWMVERLRKE